MTLDLLQVAPHIAAMAREAGVRRQAAARRREHAVTLLRAWSARLEDLRALLDAEPQRPAAEPLEPLLNSRPAPAVPGDLAVVATDGSSIDLDRHGPAQCFLINVGAATLRYGAAPAASLTAQATLYYHDYDLFVDERGTRLPVQGALVDLKRTVAEQQRALELVAALHTATREESLPIVAIADGSLLLWTRDGAKAEQSSFVRDALDAHAAGLDAFRHLGVPICSYISRPNSHEVVELLRLAACPSGPADASGRLLCPSCLHGACAREALETLPDRALMGHLRPGQRSARFASRSPVLRYYSPAARAQFFYLNVGDEIARVEVPAWVGDDPAALDLVHGAVYDGCTRGWGYPPALAEAHEQAIIRGAEREAFTHLIMEALNAADQPVELSLKQTSKNRRAV